MRNLKPSCTVFTIISKAAEVAGIKRIGYLLSLVQRFKGIDWWMFKIKRLACDILRDSPVPITIFYPSNFYENLPELQLKGSRVMLAGTQTTQNWWISAHDYGKQVACSFQILDEENKEYSVQGPEPYNFEEAADVFINHYQSRKLIK